MTQSVNFALEPFGLLSGMEPPLPIPNREVKHASVHDTAVFLPWDNRSRPGDSRAKFSKAEFFIE
jgi:hypothetical protein